eukprot:TRINITY_DN27037_c0_g1_i2.p1 TRINITY_DN27037_c0_g1~~TRINITY_DN27037_c0_g1_i2.p1  ORF type:complete len:263 (-),score=96.34 TRINITY_DN27037_c0_g1_i2:109-897(-)
MVFARSLLLTLATLAGLHSAAATRYASQKAHKVPSWACAVRKCSIKEGAMYVPPSLNGATRLSLRGTNAGQILCPFGGDGGNGKAASKAEADRFFDGFAKAYDKIHGIEHKEEEKETVAESNSTAAAAATSAAAAETQQEQTKDASGLKSAEVMTTDSLTKLMRDGETSFLVTFYAPWCPHCQAFVLADDAPVDHLSEELKAAGGPKVVVFDTTANALPADFGEVNAVPTIFLVQKDGTMQEFLEDPSQIENLKVFALSGGH